MNTRNKILGEALKLFNKNGYSAVSLNEIAAALDISRGNLTYHFKDKESLLRVLCEEMWIKIDQSKEASRVLPSFENLHNVLQLYYRFQKKYAFVFLDHHMLNHPTVKEQFRKMTDQTIRDNEASIAFAIQLGNMHPETIKGTYKNIAFITWMLAFFWLPQQIIRGEKTNEDGEKMMWSILLPHLTDKGIHSFKKFFGDDYFESLGEPFTADLSQFISF